MSIAPKDAKDNSDATTKVETAPVKELLKPATSTWRGWWSKPDVSPPAESEEKAAQDELHKAKDDATQTPLPESPEATKKPDPIAIAGHAPRPAAEVDTDVKDGKEDGANPSSQNRTSWFYFWSKQENAKGGEVPPSAAAPQSEAVGQPQAEETAAPTAEPTTKAQENQTPSDNKTGTKETAKSGGWAFWSRDKPKSDGASDTASTHKQVGELAVADTPSQSHPEAAQFNEQEQPSKKDTPKPAKAKRGRERLKDNQGSSKPSTPAPATPAKGTPSGSPTLKAADGALQEQLQGQATAKKKSQGKGTAQLLSQTQGIAQAPHQNNIILPQFESTYHSAQQPSYWEQLRRLFWSPGVEPPRIHLESPPPKINRALAIGVHGFFPAAMLRTVLGQPTGTSIRFANLAAAAVKEWVKQHGDYDCEIEKVALEGEGFIADRVDTLWKLLLNWIDKIRKADLILVAAHSQGVPVAVMLVAKLISFGCVSAGARIGICAMAGVNMGPFIEYRTSLLGGTANELFDFTRPESKVSMMYEEALDVVLEHGVRIAYVGSIDDQLVSLEVRICHEYKRTNAVRLTLCPSRQRLRQSPTPTSTAPSLSTRVYTPHRLPTLSLPSSASFSSCATSASLITA
jgi:hypothetical protein